MACYNSNSNVVYSCKYHVVWCPKYRRNVLIDGVDVRLKVIIGEVRPGVSSRKAVGDFHCVIEAAGL
jgi:putative transposase